MLIVYLMKGSKASVEIEDFLCGVQQVRFENHPIELQGGRVILCALHRCGNCQRSIIGKRSQELEEMLLDGSTSGGGS